MKESIDRYKNNLVQIATPYSVGTGFYLADGNVVVTNEHLVRDCRTVVVKGTNFERQLVKVLFWDVRKDLAFLEAPAALAGAPAQLGQDEIRLDQKVLAVGHPFGMSIAAAEGSITNTLHQEEGINYCLHDAFLSPIHSGSPLLNQIGEIIAVNTFLVRRGEPFAYSLPAYLLKETLDAFAAAGSTISVQCDGCSKIVTDKSIKGRFCPSCGSEIVLPSEVDIYEPFGIPKTIEDIICKAEHDVELSRRGPNIWEIQQGSAFINITYYEKNGLITGDAYLCLLPEVDAKELYQYLLQQNYEIEGLNFSVKGEEVVLSLQIYDRYLNIQTGNKLFKHLFDKADYYDNILVEQFGARWKRS